MRRQRKMEDVPYTYYYYYFHYILYINYLGAKHNKSKSTAHARHFRWAIAGVLVRARVGVCVCVVGAT